MILVKRMFFTFLTTTKKTKILLLLAGVAICLLQIWLPPYFLTADGPCHVSNARIIHDLLGNNNVDFYTRFYSVVHYPNPNWLSHIVIALLLFGVKGVIAEKIFLSGYVLLSVFGFYSLLKRLCGNDSWWPFVAFIFVL